MKKSILANLNILFFLCLLYMSSLSAQLYKIPMQDKIISSGYVFEGEVIRSDSYWNQAEDMIYTSHTIQISKIFKGDLVCGTVEVITYGGEANGERIDITHHLVLQDGDVGTFLCIPSEIERPQVDFYAETNTDVLEVYASLQGFLRYQVQDAAIIAADPFYYFDSLSHVYDIIELYTQLNYVECDIPIIQTLQNQVHKTIKPLHTVTKNTPSEVYLEQLNLLQTKRAIATQNKQTDNQQKVLTSTLYYSFENVDITGFGTGNEHLEFDIYLSADDNNAYFDGGWVYIPFDPAEFGTDLQANGKVTVTRGTILADANNYDMPLPYDAGTIPSTELLITMNAKWDPPARYLLSTTPTQAIHVSIELVDCKQPGNLLTFGDSLNMYNNSFYATTSNATTMNTQNFPNIDITDKDDCSCMTKIISISPYANGGVGDIVTIAGKYFGNTKGDIFLKNATDGGGTTVKLDAADIIGWSDTQITVSLPNFAEGNLTKVPGTGKIKIEPVNNFAWSSDSTLHIGYSLRNFKTFGNPPKAFTPHQNAPGNGNYEFYIDNEIAANVNMYNTIRKSMNDWNCVTHLDLRMGNTYTWLADTTKANDSSQIIIGQLPAGVIMGTFSRLDSCSAGKKYYKEHDLIISRDYVTNSFFLIDTTGTQDIPIGKTDFYETMLHELGHVQGLDHVIDTLDLMHYKTSSMVLIPAAARKVNLGNQTDASQGGIQAVNLSQNASLSCTNTIILALCATNGVEEALSVSFAKVFPNPAHSELSVSFNNHYHFHINFEIYNALGIPLIRVSDLKEGDFVDISLLPVGMYWVRLISDTYVQNLTFIKE